MLVCDFGIPAGVIMFPTLYEYRVRPYWLSRPIGSDELRWLYQCFKKKVRGEQVA